MANIRFGYLARSFPYYLVSPLRRRVKILLLTPDFPPAIGGIQILLFRLVEHWTRVQTRIFTLEAPGSQDTDNNQTLDTRRVRRPSIGGQVTAVGLLDALALLEACRFRPDVVLSGHVNTGLAAAVLKRLLRIPYVQYLYGKEVVARPAVSRLAICSADAVIAISTHTAAHALQFGARPERVHRIPPGVDHTFKIMGNERRFAAPTIVTVARLEDRYKGHDVLIRGLPLVRHRVPDARLVVVGDGALRPVYEELACALAVRTSVEFVGAVSEEERNAWLRRAHVFAMPSRLSVSSGFEGFGIVYLEAGMHNLPVIAGDTGGTVDAVIDGETGRLVPADDHIAVAEAISDLLANPEKAAVLGNAGRKHAERFLWPRISEQVEQLLIEVARSH